MVCRNYAPELVQTHLHGREAAVLLTEEHLPLVAAVVHRFPWHGWEREELYQQGCVGLMKAMARFDPAYGIAFSTYAAAIILNEMHLLCRNDAPLDIPRRNRDMRSRVRRAECLLTKRLGREPTVQELAAALRMNTGELMLAMEHWSVPSWDAVPGHRGHALAELMLRQDDRMNRLLRHRMADMTREEQRLLLMRCYLRRTQAETARAMGLSQVQVSRREAALKATLQEIRTNPS
ncbi:MAG: sigma-70 family RNA polymerase sigma factor [Aristaeellaceae bacterium]